MQQAVQEGLGTVSSLLHRLESDLARAKADPTLAEWIVAEVTGFPRLALRLYADAPLSRDAGRKAGAWATRVAAGEPLQYVLGWTPFLGLDLACDARALIPRPETEVLVEHLLEHPRFQAMSAPIVVDVGAGAGGIALAVAKARPDARVIAVDASTAALSLARENGVRAGMSGRVRFVRGDLLPPHPGRVDVVVSNPPYVTTAEYEKLPEMVRLHEPRRALEAGPQGLDVLNLLVPRAGRALRSGGLLLLETSPPQARRVACLAARHGFYEVGVYNDLNHKERVVCACRI